MSRTVTALDGESLDGLVWRETGQDTGAVELVLAANPGLAAIGTALPGGTAILIPDLPASSAPELDIIQLWD